MHIRVSGLLESCRTLRDHTGQARAHQLPDREESYPQVKLHRPGSNNPHLLLVQQRLSLGHQPTQPHEEVQRQELTQPGAAIISQDRRRLWPMIQCLIFPIYIIVLSNILQLVNWISKLVNQKCGAWQMWLQGFSWCFEVPVGSCPEL